MKEFLTAILTLIVGSYLTYIYEELKHKKSDYRSFFTSRIDEIRNWGEYIESKLHGKLELNENEIKKLFYMARRVSIRLDRKFKTGWLRKIDNIQPIALNLCEDLHLHSRQKSKDDVLNLLAPFLDELEFWRFKLFSDPYPGRAKLCLWRFLSKFHTQ